MNSKQMLSSLRTASRVTKPGLNLMQHYQSDFFDTEEGRAERDVAQHLRASLLSECPATSYCGCEIQSVVKAASEFLLATMLDPAARGSFFDAIRKQCDVIYYG